MLIYMYTYKDESRNKYTCGDVSNYDHKHQVAKPFECMYKFHFSPRIALQVILDNLETEFILCF